MRKALLFLQLRQCFLSFLLSFLLLRSYHETIMKQHVSQKIHDDAENCN